MDNEEQCGARTSKVSGKRRNEKDEDDVLPVDVKRHEIDSDRNADFRPESDQYTNNDAPRFLSLDSSDHSTTGAYDAIERQLVDYIAEHEIDAEDMKRREEICAGLEQTFRRVFPGGRLSTYGSTVNSLGTRNSDIDVCFAPNSQNMEMTKEDRQDVVHRLYKHVKKTQRDTYGNIQAILKTACPILKLTHTNSRIEIDVSIDNRSAIFNSDLLRWLCQTDRRVRGLMFLARQWAKENGLVVTRNGLSCYAVCLLVLFYLQRTAPPILPPIDTLATAAADVRTFDGWQFAVSKDISLLPHSPLPPTAMELFSGFTSFYEQFPFRNSMISTRLGHCVDKDRVATFGWDDERVQEFQWSSVNIQDPFVLSRNVGFRVDDAMYDKMIEAFRQTAARCHEVDYVNPLFGGLRCVLSSRSVESNRPATAADAAASSPPSATAVTASVASGTAGLDTTSDANGPSSTRGRSAVRHLSTHDPQQLLSVTRSRDADFQLTIDRELSVCDCCLETFRSADDSVVVQPCLHTYCRSCISRYVEMIISANQDVVDRIWCLREGCTSSLSLRELKQVVIPEHLNNIARRAAQRLNLAANSNDNLADLSECSYCGFLVADREQSFSYMRCTNPLCWNVTCRICRAGRHFPISCEYAALETKLRHEVEQHLAAVLPHRCLSCASDQYSMTSNGLARCAACDESSCFYCKCRVYDCVCYPSLDVFTHVERRLLNGELITRIQGLIDEFTTQNPAARYLPLVERFFDSYLTAFASGGTTVPSLKATNSESPGDATSTMNNDRAFDGSMNRDPNSSIDRQSAAADTINVVPDTTAALTGVSAAIQPSTTQSQNPSQQPGPFGSLYNSLVDFLSPRKN